MSRAFVSPGDMEQFVNSENPTTCPLCCSRTQFLEQHERQLHWCMNKDCGIIFLTVDDEEES